MFNVMSEMELAVHELKNAREKLNVKHLGNMTNVEKEMDEVCNFMSNSGRIQKLIVSARGLAKGEAIGNNSGLEKTTPRGSNNL
jgi:hypothetical protein